MKEINPNKNFISFDVVVDRERFEHSFEGLSVLGVAFGPMLYQLFAGVEKDD